MVLVGMTLEAADVDSTAFAVPDGYVGKLYGGDDLIQLANQHPAILADSWTIEECVRRGDRCYALTANGELAAHGWYSVKPTSAALDGLQIRFDSAWSYMHAGFTAEGHRGRRLHGVGMYGALDALTAEGARGLVSIVEATNHSSLKSCARLGYKNFGKLYVLKVGGRDRTCATPGCRRLGFQLVSSE